MGNDKEVGGGWGMMKRGNGGWMGNDRVSGGWMGNDRVSGDGWGMIRRHRECGPSIQLAAVN